MRKKILFLIIGVFMLLLSGCAYGTYSGDYGYPDYYGDYYYGYPWYGFHEHHEFLAHLSLPQNLIQGQEVRPQK